MQHDETIFDRARRLEDPCARSEYLDAACGRDTPLRQELDRLLAADVNGDEFLESPAYSGTTQDLSSGRTTPVSTHIETFPPDGESPAKLDESLRIRLRDYEQVCLVGRGAMGAVLSAWDPKLHRLVAIKVPRGEILATRSTRERFLREARSAAAINHSNVVTIYGVDDSGEPPLIIMEFVEGATLREKIEAEGRLPAEAVVRVARQVALGLSAAHRRELIHRDIKPSNLVLTADDTVKIIDFGLARTSDDLTVTHSGVLIGSPRYMSPEQIEGTPLDGRSDLFSLGVVLHELLVGEAPFTGATTLAILDRVLRSEPRPVCEIVPDTPAWLGDVVGGLLTKNRDERIPSAETLIGLLDRRRTESRANGTAGHLTATARTKERRRTSSVVVALLAMMIAGVALLSDTPSSVLKRFLYDAAGENTRADRANDSKPIDRGPIVVSTLADATSLTSDGPLTLRKAIELANRRPGPDTIEFGGEVVGDLTLSDPLPRITDDLSIVGPGADRLTIDAGGNATPDRIGDGFRVLWVDNQKPTLIRVTVSGVTLTGGDTREQGGAIFATEHLTLNGVRIIANSAGSEGGGVMFDSAGDLVIRDSTLHGNRCAGHNADGGALSARGGILLIERSTLSDNFANAGGGAYLNGLQRADIRETTISGNRSLYYGGGLFATNGPLTIERSTVVQNRTKGPEDAEGGGMYWSVSTPCVLRASIVAENEAEQGPADIRWVGVGLEVTGCLIGDGEGLPPAPVGAAPNLIRVTPLLGPLANNGGPTHTHAPLPGSPVIDACDPAAGSSADELPPFDQRGASFSRVCNGLMDLGAVEACTDAAE